MDILNALRFVARRAPEDAHGQRVLEAARGCGPSRPLFWSGRENGREAESFLGYEKGTLRYRLTEPPPRVATVTLFSHLRLVSPTFHLRSLFNLQV